MRSPLSLLVPALALLLAGCDAAGDDQGPIVSEADRAFGAEQHPQLLAEFGGPYQAEESAYVARLGGKMADAAGLDGQCTFTLVNSDVVNAFAVPGCFIYVTRGLMSIVNSEAELASVLAHEIGHITGRHVQRQQNRSIWRGLGVLAVGILTGSDRLTRIAGEAATYFTLRYSRKSEYEADDRGLSYLIEAGYDPYAASDMLNAIGRQEEFLARTRGQDEARSIPEWGRTHPLTQNRIERARDEARKTGVAEDELPENEAAYLKELDGLLYGDDPAQGFVIGRRFAHPEMRIAFEAPPGFTLTNSPQAILIEGPDGLRGEFAGGPIPPGGLPAYADRVLSQLLKETAADPGEPRYSTVNGLPTLFLPVMVQTPDGPVALSLAIYDAGDGHAYHFILISGPSTPPAAATDALFRSFRILSETEARSLRPRFINIVRAGPGDTVRSLAARMASENKLARFLMLNGRAEDDPVKPGERLKIVAYSAR
ncbi:M48 family metalloprotease [Sphingosinicella rhizophila]|uniref:M48 family metalloprotease n=1 Tax=Sphingosinicella rhizophila TaxID=3050082 RepID=A0ABU3QB12_9SPHN|nr:M48 family metalloprotease [Sphingosinicella sp. GR2756]MDT9600590.1 M48 family metalloprotease [Sphingosinicella sp. GR2756]